MKGWGNGLFGGNAGGDDAEDEDYCGRECYEFNDNLEPNKDDECCEHCRFYMTLQCKHIDEFIDEDE